MQYSSNILLTKQFVACQLNQAKNAIIQFTQYFASVQIINQQCCNRILKNSFSYCCFGVSRGEIFCLWGVAPWPPLVAALAERDILRGARNTLRGGTVTPRRGSDTLRCGKVTLRGGKVTLLEGRDSLRGGTVVTLRGERDTLRGGRGILRGTLNFVKVVSS